MADTRSLEVSRIARRARNDPIPRAAHRGFVRESSLAKELSELWVDLVMETYVAIDPEFRELFRKRGLADETSVSSPRDRIISRSSSDSRNLERSRIRHGY